MATKSLYIEEEQEKQELVQSIRLFGFADVANNAEAKALIRYAKKTAGIPLRSTPFGAGVRLYTA